MTSTITQTKILLGKNWKSKRRTEFKKLLGELGLPVFYLVILSFLVRLEPRKTYPESKIPVNPINILSSLNINPPHLFSVVNIPEDTTNRMEKTWNDNFPTISSKSVFSFRHFNNEKELEMDYLNQSDVGSYVGILLENEKYVIRVNAELIPDVKLRKVGLETCRGDACPVNGYFYSHFLAVNYLLGFENGANITIQDYPKAEYVPGMSTFLRILIPLYCIIPLAQLINALLILIVTEKENRIKDGLKMIGVSDMAYWLSWFIIYGMMAVIFAFMFTIVMHFMNVLKNINPVILFLLFMLFGLSIITFAFALTPFFHKPKTAGAVGTLIMQFTGMLFMVQTFLFNSSFLMPLRLISSVAFTTALDDACAYEYHGGISIGDLFTSRGSGILYSLLFLALDTFLYLILAIYLDNVIPNEYGVRKHALFFLDFSGGKKESIKKAVEEMNENEDVEKIHPSLINKESIQIRNLKKVYNNTAAVDGISLDIYEGHITAILGRNGAGKSTLVNMITGLVPPSSGQSLVYGLDITNPNDMTTLRKMTGVCMQEDLHFPSLTTREHLEFYGGLRGIEKTILEKEIKDLLSELELDENTAAAKLSGGQKRKLSVGIALIGSPKLILLDEPSAGVDPVSRRQLWSLLQKRKNGRIIILTTHFMDEADVLADRKAIIHNGVLKCFGSSLFLKNRFGVGYQLTVELLNDVNESVDQVIRKWIPEITPGKIFANEVKYILPHDQVSKFANLFRDFDGLIASDLIKSYGVSMTTLDEVFLKISNDAEIRQTVEMPHRRMSTLSTGFIPDVEVKRSSARIFFAMFLLRFRRLIRNPMSLFFMVFMPVLMVVIGFLILKLQTGIQTHELLMGADIYPHDSFVTSNKSDQQFQNFLKSKRYSGEFEDLLGIPDGTMGAFQVIGNKASLRINGTFLHMPGILLNVLDEYFGLNMKTVNRPFPSKNQRNFDQSTFFAVFLIGPVFSFSAIGMVMEIVNDREKLTRNHLRVNGLSFQMYYGSIFSVFGLLSLLITVMAIVVIFAFNVSSFTNPYAITVALILLLLFILPCLLFSATLSYFFDRMETAQSVFSQISSFLGSIVGIAMILIDGFAPKYSVLIHGIFCALDIFYIPFGIFYWINKQHVVCTLLNNCENLSFSDYTGPEFITMALVLLAQIPIFGILLFMADFWKNGGEILDRRPNSVSNYARLEQDDDVLAEKSRVDTYFENGGDEIVLAVQDLHKSYKEKVLNGVNLMVEEGQVFGLLGHNGAGKTTTIKTIIADEKPDTGNISICGEKICPKAFTKLGYCGQHDALWDNITLMEHMELYGIVRGVGGDVIEHFLKGLQIQEHAHKKTKKLSGGTKRKLSYCMSMLGSPKIVLLDEPSTGMDISSKRFLWNTILSSFKDSRGAILTTHSMEEADALCTRIGIMVKGSLICLGSPQHLKSKYGLGYILEIKSCQDFDFVKRNFPESKLNEVFENRAVFSIPSISSIPETFELLERLKQEHNIEEYAFSQTTLEQVFLQFAR